MAKPDRATLVNTAHGLIAGYNKWDIEAIMALRAPNCIQQVYPARLKQPPLNNEAYRKYFMPFLSVFKDYHIDIMQTVADVETQTVVLHMRSTSTTPVGDYNNEFSIYLQMTDDGRKIVEIKEFVDSGFSVDYFGRLRQYMESQQAERSRV